MPKIILLGGKGTSTPVVFNYLNKEFGVAKAIIEDKEKTAVFIKRRLAKLGWRTVLGQLAFQLSIPRLLNSKSGERIAAIKNTYQLDATPIPETKKQTTDSINHPSIIDFLNQEQPDLIVVNGTRIIGKKLLAAINCPIINTHAGITPKYRGVHGAYWAMYNNDLENCGVTVHYIDPGIDTGSILAQKNIIPTTADNFVTYPYMQLGAGMQLLKEVIPMVLDGTAHTFEKKLDSKLYYHPTLYQYLKSRWIRKIK